jgi:hypothetical protein
MLIEGSAAISPKVFNQVDPIMVNNMQFDEIQEY